MKRYQAIIIGRGLSALATALRLTELGITELLIVGEGSGGSPLIAAINFVLPDNPYGDTPEAYAQDMLAAGYGIGDRQLVMDMAQKSAEGYAFLTRAGIRFATEADGSLKRRHLSGHRCPRSLCQTTELIGLEMEKRLTALLRERGVSFSQSICVRLLSDGRHVYGVTLLDRAHFNKLDNVYASVVVAAWGGVGHLFTRTTYPGDVNGRTLALAYRAGAALCDLEFLEYEPMVVIEPQGAAGEPCPTAILGEGGYLKNQSGERFVLKLRPQGEAGAPKSLINKLIWEQNANGKGSPHGGCWVDLRHIPVDVLKGYPWFYNRITSNGLDPNREMIEVAPMAHSFSGGIRVNRQYRSSLESLYAVGEAAGGVHGACRCAGNAASQAVLSGIICAEAIAQSGETQVQMQQRFPCERRIELGVYQRYAPRIQAIAQKGLPVYRTREAMQEALAQLDALSKEQPVRQDEDTQDLALAVRLMLIAALNRKESRGTHLRLDYPDMLPECERSFAWNERTDSNERV